MAFTMQYPARCCICDQDIPKGKQGMMMNFAAKDIAHYPSCPPKPEVCNKCFQQKTPTGACACD